MASFKCICGNDLSNCRCPNEVVGFLFRDCDTEFEGGKTCGDVADLAQEVWECDKCGRLAIFNRGQQSKPIRFVPESGRHEGIMKFDRCLPIEPTE